MLLALSCERQYTRQDVNREIECHQCGKRITANFENSGDNVEVSCPWCGSRFIWSASYDICANRHRGNTESVEANALTNKAQGRRRVIEWLEQCGPEGDSCYFISQSLGMPYTTASARISELRKLGVVICKPKPEGGYYRKPTPTGSSAAILILDKFAPPSRFDSNGQSHLF